MITIFEDIYQYQQPLPEALVAANSSDYVHVRMAIRHALTTQTSLTVHITHPTLLHWFKDIRSYPADVVSWKVVDPDDEFTQFFGFAPPPLFTSNLIVQLDLASLKPPVQGVTVEPVGWILSQKLHDLWGYTQVYPKHIAQLAVWAIHQQSIIPDNLLPLVQAQIDQWSEQNPDYKYFHASTLYADSTRLLLKATLQRYSQQWLQQQGYSELPIIDISDQYEVCRELLHEQEALITTYWNRAFASSNQSSELTIAFALEQMSGLSNAELKAITSFLDRHPKLLNADLLQQIEERFKYLLSVSDVVREIYTRVMPEIPTLPDETWTKEQWLSWATQDYMPYFAWIIRNGQPREYQQTCALAFADWLIESYPDWLNTETSPLITNQYQQMRQILNDDAHALVVWLVVDGLTWWQGEYLLSKCNQHRISVQSQVAGVVALPSITSISKRVLVTGLPAVEPMSHSIAQAARDQLGKGGIPSYVCSKIQEGIHILQDGEPIRCLMILFNMIDTIAHETSDFSDNAGIHGYLQELVDGLVKIKQVCDQKGKTFHALVGSDHGSTLIPTDAKCLPIPREAKEVFDILNDESSILAEKHSPRAVVVNDLNRISSDIDQQWYVLDRTLYQLAQNYLVPRGYSYVGKRPHGWTHGGLTPEEVIVPIIHLISEQVQIEPIEVRFEGSIRANQQTPLTMIIVNPNQVIVQEITIQVNDVSELPTIENIDAQSSLDMEIIFPAISTRETELMVHWNVQCLVLGLRHRWQGQQSITIRRLQVEDTSIDDFFD